jgi:hypothetical protein
MRLFYVAPGGKLALYDVTLDPAAADGQEASLADAAISEGELYLVNSGLPGQQAGAPGPQASVAVLSAAAASSNGAGTEFRILSPLGVATQVVEHYGVTGDDRGGIAASSSHVFYTGDAGTGRFDLDDLSGGTNLGPTYDSLTSNLHTGVIYSLGVDAATPHVGGWGFITHLLEHDGVTLALTGNTIPLSTPIYVDSNTGIFAGYDRVVLHSSWDYHVYNIDLPSGAVTDMGYVGYLDHMGCENWAYWGVAEYFEGVVYLVYIQPSAVVRTQVDGGQTTTLEYFGNLGDMCGFTVSPLTNRWYFHFDGWSPFGSYDEALGYGDAVLFIGDRPLIVPFPTPLVAKQPLGSMIYDPVLNVPVRPEHSTVVTIDVDPGQTLTVLAEPDPDLELTLTLLDPADQPLAQAVGDSPGAPVLLNAVPAVPAGTYSVVLRNCLKRLVTSEPA